MSVEVGTTDTTSFDALFPPRAISFTTWPSGFTPEQMVHIFRQGETCLCRVELEHVARVGVMPRTALHP